MTVRPPRPEDPPRRGLRIDTGLTAAPLDPAAALAAVADPACGGIGLFVGVVRDHHEGQAVTGLTYEAWEREAAKGLRAVAESVGEEFADVRAVYAWHRTGPLAVGDASVVVAASAPHRAEAIAATGRAIDRLKADVPIWKHEHLADGTDRWPGIDTGRSGTQRHGG